MDPTAKTKMTPSLSRNGRRSLQIDGTGQR
jgi:hypothetical protein